VGLLLKVPFLYNGKYGVQTDSNGLIHMRARYYNPYLQRFLNPDPIGFSGGPNWFAFADGDPISALDPFGLWSWNQTMGALKFVGGIAEVAVGVSVGAAASWTGIGAVAGGAVALHGLDTLQAGFRQMVSGEEKDTLTSSGLQALGLSRSTANLVDAGIGLASGTSGIVQGVSKTAAIMKLPEASGMSVPRALYLWEKGSVALTDESFKALNATAPSALHKGLAIEQGAEISTSFAKGFSLFLNTGMTPAGDMFMGGASAASGGFRSLK